MCYICVNRWFKSAITCIDSLDVHVYSFPIDVMFLCKKPPGLEVGLDLEGEQVGVGEQ